MDGGLRMSNDMVESTRNQQAELVASNKALLAETDSLRKQISEMEQYSRINNVEIKGEPFSKDGDFVAIVAAIAEKATCPLSPVEVDIVHSVPTVRPSKHHCKVLLTRQKTEFLANVRKARLDVGSLGFSGENKEPIVIHEHLTPDYKKLFAQALALKKEKGWRFLWTKNCRINARKSEDSWVHRNNSAADLSVFT